MPHALYATAAVLPTDSASLAARVRGERIGQTVVLAMVLALPALFCIHMAVVSDPDIWWHLRTGEWIVQHGTVPRVDPFSSTSAGKPWEAYSWLFELAIFRQFHAFGLAGVVGYTAAMLLAITAALYRLVSRMQQDFSVSVALTLLAVLCMDNLLTPRPWLFTILFFALELDILMHARRTGRALELAWLPIIFALWANFHIQFVDGLVVLGIALAEAVVSRFVPTVTALLRPRWLALALVVSLIATCANPYGWHIYRTAYELASQTGVLDKIDELKAMPFRAFPEYCTLFLALAAAAALARGQKLLSFESAVLAFATVVSFRSQRDVWLLTIVGVAILAQAIKSVRPRIALPAFAYALAGCGAAAALSTGLALTNSTGLNRRLADSAPVQAVEFVKKQGYSGPLYNDFNWGGYLIWALRMAVSIDGRAALHGDAALNRSVATTMGRPGWQEDPELASAGLVILPTNLPLTQLLRVDSRFHKVYEDQVAVVFVTSSAVANASTLDRRKGPLQN